MSDEQIVALFHERKEAAIAETAGKYGKYFYYIAYQILHNEQDSEECVNDTYLRAWNTIPPQKPKNLSAFLGKITRNLALDKYKYDSREKRGGGQILVALDELDECITSANDTEKIISDKELTDALNRFLAGLPVRKRQIFLRRYWYFSTISEIAKDFGMSESNVKIILHRTRRELKIYLEMEGIID